MSIANMTTAMLSSKQAVPAVLKATPSSRSARTTAIKVTAKVIGGRELTPGQQYASKLPGISQPFPQGFDPLELTKYNAPAEIKRWRESELMHGRVAMLAAVGFVVQEQLQDFPAFLNFDGVVTGPAIYHFQQIEENRPLFWEVLLIAIGLCESYRVAIGWSTPTTGGRYNLLKDDYEAGNLGFDPLGILNGKSEDFIKDLQTRELNNGRLAMLGIIGFWIQELMPPHEPIFAHLAVNAGQDAAEKMDVVAGSAATF